MNELAPLFRDEQRRTIGWIKQVTWHLYAEQDGRCAICGDAMSPDDWHHDHRIPFCYGGQDEADNIQLVHPACNLRKGKQADPREVLDYLWSRYQAGRY